MSGVRAYGCGCFREIGGNFGDLRLCVVQDGGCSGQANPQGFGLTLGARDEAEAQRLFSGLSEGGQVRMPLGKTFFSPAFGMVADKFGILWMVIVEH